MSKRLVFLEDTTIELTDYRLPERLEPDELRTRNTHGAEKHGTMQAFLHEHGNKRGRWDAARRIFVPGGVVLDYPIALGNMQVGVVEAIGSAVRDFAVGDRVLFHRCFEPESVVVQSAVWKLDETTSWKSATCLDPATYALCALRDGNARIGDAVGIFGLGAIGLIAVRLAKLTGCAPVVAIDPLRNRRETAQELGADAVVDPAAADAGERLREITSWRGADVVVEYSGSVQALQAALRGVAFGGTLVCGAFPSPYPAGLDLGAEAHMNRPTIVFSRSESEPNRDHPRWDNVRLRDTVHRMILDGLIDGEAIVAPVLPFDEGLPAGYEAVMASPQTSIKLGVAYPQ